MKIILTINLILLSLLTEAQTTISAADFSKGYNFEEKENGSVVARKKGFGDYKIKVPKSGYYTFTIPILNDMGIATYLTIKTPTGSKILATIPIPLNAQWQTFTAQVKLSTLTKSIRLSVGDDITINSFTYQPTLIDTAQARPSGDYVSKTDFINMKVLFDNMVKQVNDYQKQIDSLKANLSNRVIPLDQRVFMKMADSTTVTLRPEILRTKK